MKILGQNDEAKETLDNQQNAEAARERYYATIHKVALQTGTEKIPGFYNYYTLIKGLYNYYY